MKNRVFWILIGLFLVCINLLEASEKLVLVEDGVSVAPIVIYKDAPLLTRETADVLADYIEKTSDARPEVLEGQPDPLPEHAIWVGYQPVMDDLFPDVDFDFQHPEEIFIAANDNHLAITGRDRWDPEHPFGLDRKGERIPGMQFEYGTANAVYTFIQDYLGVRWLWPGELGEDIDERETVAFEPFRYRHHPQIRLRHGILRFSALAYGGSGYGHSRDWVRHQRLDLDSFHGLVGGHGFGDWWERFHETHPEYFAQLPDGTRRLVTKAHHVKLCHSNPAVWQQWLRDVKQEVPQRPYRNIYNASPNDGGLSGHCVCDRCRAWDHPDAETLWFRWGGTGREGPAISDRQVKFVNTVARMLKEAYPDKGLRVATVAYGNWRPAPVEAVPDDNVIIVNVANMFWNVNAEGRHGPPAEQWADWAEKTDKQIWRPNTGNPAGWMNGLPDIPLARTMESLKFVADRGCVGIYIDSVWEQWATQGPLYYAMAHVAWDTSVDWRAKMDDYYRRGYGPAAAELEAYWTLLRETRNRIVDDYESQAQAFREEHDQAFFDKANGLLDRAAEKVAGAPEKYRKRIDFTRAGLDHIRLITKMRDLSGQFLVTEGKDKEIAQRLRDKWDEMKRNCDKYKHALNWLVFRPSRRMTRGGIFHPDNIENAKHVAGWKAAAEKEAEDAPDAKKQSTRKPGELQAAEAAGWQPVFSDDFNRDELGDQWDAVEGEWEIADGALTGQGLLLSARGFPGGGSVGFQRMEFEAAAAPGSSRISDMSSLLHAREPGKKANPAKAGYFFQFGGKWNSRNSIASGGTFLVTDGNADTTISPDKRHKIVVQNDGGRLSMYVDGQGVLAARQETVILDEKRDRIGFSFWTPMKIFNVKVYVKPVSSGLDDEDADVQ